MQKVVCKAVVGKTHGTAVAGCVFLRRYWSQTQHSFLLAAVLAAVVTLVMCDAKLEPH